MKPLEKVARTIAGLYNNARPLGMGRLHFTPEKLGIDEAKALAREAIEKGSIHFDYYRGRVMKVRIDAEGKVSLLELYDRDNGHGRGAAAITEGLADPFYAELARGAA